MITQELRAQVFNLPVRDRLSLAKEIIDSVQEPSQMSQAEISAAIQRMRGLLVTDKPAPTDEEVDAILAERRMEKFGA